MTADTPVLRVYSRQGCHLCEKLLEDLLPIVRGRLRVDVIDIDSDERLRSLYDTRVPVVEFAGESLCEYTLDAAAIREILAGVDGSSAL